MSTGVAPLDTSLACGLQHAIGDHGVVEQDHRVVGLDKAHAAHVRGQVEDVLAAFDNLLAVFEQAQVDQLEFIAKHLLLGIVGPVKSSSHVS